MTGHDGTIMINDFTIGMGTGMQTCMILSEAELEWDATRFEIVHWLAIDV